MSNEETEEGIDPAMLQVPVIENRREKRKMLKIYKKDLEEHVKRKPKVNIDEESITSQEEGVTKVRVWGSKYMYLVRKVAEYES